MSHKSSETEHCAISLPITAQIRDIAERFAARQPTKEKAEQVLLNTIAVSIVNNYLKMLGIDTDLADSDSINPVMQLCENTADLEIVGIGKLECRPIVGTANSCYVPWEVRDLRIGYTVVRIDTSFRKAEILGFISQVATEELPLNNLQPIEALIDRIHELKTSQANDSIVNLGQWFNNIFETGWQNVESLFSSEQLILAFDFRNLGLRNSNESEQLISDNSIAKAKVIDLGVRLSDRHVILLVKLVPENNNDIGVTLQVHPQKDEITLPYTLKLRVLENFETVFLEAQARERDNYIQLQFSGQPQEVFTVEILLDDAKFTEQFQL